MYLDLIEMNGLCSLMLLELELERVLAFVRASTSHICVYIPQPTTHARSDKQIHVKYISISILSTTV